MSIGVSAIPVVIVAEGIQSVASETLPLLSLLLEPLPSLLSLERKPLLAEHGSPRGDVALLESGETATIR